MNDRFAKGKPTASSEPTYDVGYRKPPKATQFKPGLSGNPRGRSKRPKRVIPHPYEEQLKSIIFEEAYRLITIRDGNRNTRIPLIQAIIRSLGLFAAKGHQRSQRMFIDLLKLVERESRAQQESLLEAAIQYKANWENELERRKRLGITGPEPLPHPDDVVVDLKTGEVSFKGPLTKEDKVKWELLRQRKTWAKKEIAELRRLLKKDADNPMLLEDLEFEQSIYDKIAKLIPD